MRLGLAGLWAALLVLPAAAANGTHAGPETHIVTAHDRDTANGTVAWFQIDNRTRANPTLELEPGQRVLLHFVNAGEREHTLAIGEPVLASMGPVAPGNETSGTLRVPANATGPVPYRDPPWADRGMRGTFAVNATGEPREAPPAGPAALAGLGAATALLARRRGT